MGGCKFKRPENSSHGATAYVLILPLLVRTSDKDRLSAVRFKRCPEGVFMKDLESRTKGNLTDNLVVKRMNKFAIYETGDWKFKTPYPKGRPRNGASFRSTSLIH
ncbi:hypothetical protein Barb4_01057 [Bacteroidales bacterium Barb4]|nr:hypothetical protein Barb4_01057 [Bacteroidales bacterium Barb4]